MDNLPLETLSYIFTYLDTVTCIQNKAVCKSWRTTSSRHCGYCIIQPRRGYTVNGLTVEAKESRSTLHAPENGKDERVIVPSRTRGHLPQPRVIDCQTRMISYCASNIVQIKHIASQSQMALAIRLEQVYCSTQVDVVSISSLDLGTSRILASSRVFPPCTLTTKKWLRVVDLGSLCYLQRLSVRGCSALHTLRIPASLVALDACGCNALKTISMYQEYTYPDRDGIDGNGSHSGLEALNLNGCRALGSDGIFSNDQVLRRVEDLDLTSVTRLSKQRIAQALRHARNISTISLRYVANNEMMDALALCPAAHTELRLVDVAFSDVNDEVVEKLVNHARALDRLNLRGCRHISGDCYNQVPIYLSKKVGSHGEAFVIQCNQSSDGRKRRKGDNIFYFTS